MCDTKSSSPRISWQAGTPAGRTGSSLRLQLLDVCVCEMCSDFANLHGCKFELPFCAQSAYDPRFRLGLLALQSPSCGARRFPLNLRRSELYSPKNHAKIGRKFHFGLNFFSSGAPAFSPLGVDITMKPSDRRDNARIHETLQLSNARSYHYPLC